MSFLLLASVFWTLPLGIAAASWMAAKFGARATIWLMFPFPVMIAHVHRYARGGIEEMSLGAFESMMTVPLALSWAIPYFHLSRLIDGRIGNRKLEALLTFLLATACAALLQAIYEPFWQALCTGPMVQMIAVYVLLAASLLLMRLPTDERAPRDAMPTAGSMLFRTVSVVAIVALIFLTAERPGPWALVFAFLLTFPRMTFELAISTQVTNGVVAARQVLAGLPHGIVTITVWCYALVWLPKTLSDGTVIATAFALTVLALAAWIRFYASRWAPRPGWIWTAERAPDALREGSPA